LLQLRLLVLLTDLVVLVVRLLRWHLILLLQLGLVDLVVRVDLVGLVVLLLQMGLVVLVVLLLQLRLLDLQMVQLIQLGQWVLVGLVVLVVHADLVVLLGLTHRLHLHLTHRLLQ
jgi:hypothetical protein